MTTECEHTYIPVSSLQSVCARCSHVLTAGNGRCFRCGAPMDDHFGIASGPAPGTCVTIGKRVQQ